MTLSVAEYAKLVFCLFLLIAGKSIAGPDYYAFINLDIGHEVTRISKGHFVTYQQHIGYNWTVCDLEMNVKVISCLATDSLIITLSDGGSNTWTVEFVKFNRRYIGDLSISGRKYSGVYVAKSSQHGE